MSPLSRGLIRGDSGCSGFDGARLYHGIVGVRDRLPPFTKITADFDAAEGADARTPSCAHNQIKHDDRRDATRRGLFASRPAEALRADDQGGK